MSARTNLHFALGLAVVFTLSAQSTGVPTHFEVASVKVSTATDNLPPQIHGFGRQSGGPGSTTPGQFTATGISLKNLLFRDAYQFKEYQYVALPWMEKETYDVVAKVPPDISRDQFRVMLQNLLIERFQIEFHHEQRDATTYDLVVAKGGLKMKPSKFAPDTPLAPGPGRGGSIHMDRDADGFLKIPDDAGPMSFATGMNFQAVMITNKGSIKQLIEYLSRNLNLQITDKTGLSGDFAYLLHYAPNNATMPARAGSAALPNDAAGSGADVDVAPTIFGALQSQLGLKLDPHKSPIDVLVVDKAEKTPIEN